MNDDNSATRNSSCSTATVFAWIGAILINAAFIALVSWGAAKTWPVGFVLCFLYALFLFALPTLLRRKLGSEMAETDSGSIKGKGILPSLLYLLACVAVGVTGLFIPMNLISCNRGQSRPFSESPLYEDQWIANVSSFPSGVREWAESVDSQWDNGASFAYLNGTGMILFAGREAVEPDDSSVQRVLRVPGKGGAAPQVVSNETCPNEFVLVSDNTACYVATMFQGVQAGRYFAPCDRYNRGVIACAFTSGNDVNVRTLNASNARSLFVHNSIVWYRSNPPEKKVYSADGVVYSLDTTTMEATLHSAKAGTEGNSPVDGSYDDWDSSCTRKAALATLFLSALPVMVCSLALWVKKSVPSMPLATYSALTAIVLCICFSIHPHSYTNVDVVLKWWLSLSSAVWLIALLFLSLTNRIMDATLQWSSSCAGLVFLVGMMFLYEPFTSDTWWRWVLLTLTCFVPLIGLGIVTNRLFLVLLGAIGLLIDSYRLAVLVAKSFAESYSEPVIFVVLALAGTALAIFGIALNRRQDPIRTAVSAWAERRLGRFRLEGGGTDKETKGVGDTRKSESFVSKAGNRNVDTAVMLA